MICLTRQLGKIADTRQLCACVCREREREGGRECDHIGVFVLVNYTLNWKTTVRAKHNR